MALNNILLLSQVAGYVVALILSLCIVVPMSLHQDEFRGHCLLFSTGVWQETDGQLKVDWASQAYCNYSIFVGVILFLTAGIQIYRLGCFLYKGVDSSFLSSFIDVVSCICLAGMTSIAALIITFGFMIWCQNITQRFSSCDIGENEIINQNAVDTRGFYMELGTAQFGAWGSFASWVGLAVCALLKLCRYHQLENIRVSMYRERQKLVNENALNDGSSGSSLERESVHGTDSQVPTGAINSIQYIQI